MYKFRKAFIFIQKTCSLKKENCFAAKSLTQRHNSSREGDRKLENTMELRNYIFYYDFEGRKGSGKSFQSITSPRKRVLLEKIEGKPCQWFRPFL